MHQKYGYTPEIEGKKGVILESCINSENKPFLTKNNKYELILHRWIAQNPPTDPMSLLATRDADNDELNKLENTTRKQCFNKLPEI